MPSLNVASSTDDSNSCFSTAFDEPEQLREANRQGDGDALDIEERDVPAPALNIA
jgi:hypothetical protein